MDDQLRRCVKILARVLPYKGTVVAFIFDDVCNMCHIYPFLHRMDYSMQFTDRKPAKSSKNQENIAVMYINLHFYLEKVRKKEYNVH